MNFRRESGVRRTSRTWVTVGLVLWMAPGCRLSSEVRGSDRPNIVVFLVDDLGWQDTSVAFLSPSGSERGKFRTPNLERLAAGGLIFTQAYACCVCTPSRISLLTGQNAARHRATNWILRKDLPPDGKHERLEPPAWCANGLSGLPGDPLSVQAPALPQLLNAAGYRAIHVGKAHFGAEGTPGANPKNLGFDVSIAWNGAGGAGSHLGRNHFSARHRGGDPVYDVPDLQRFHGRNVFLTEALTVEANREVERAVQDRVPFFLYLAHYAVHTPIEADSRFVDRYLERGLDPIDAAYASMVEGVDQSLGDVVDNLRRRGVLERTLIVFLSDNGGLSAQGRSGTAHTHNLPLRSGKGSAYEGGIRIPLVMSWPRFIPRGTTCTSPVIIEDLFPTLIEIAGIPLTTPSPGAGIAVSSDSRILGAEPAAGPPYVDGISLLPWLEDPARSSIERALLWHYPNIWGPNGPGIGPFSALRRDRWKLIYFHENRGLELFDLGKDIGEARNLAPERLELTRSLGAELGRLLRSVGAQMPVDKTTGLTVPYPDEN